MKATCALESKGVFERTRETIDLNADTNAERIVLAFFPEFKKTNEGTTRNDNQMQSFILRKKVGRC